MIEHFHFVHRPECIIYLSQALDVSGMEILDKQHAIKDLQLFCVRWRETVSLYCQLKYYFLLNITVLAAR